MSADPWEESVAKARKAIYDDGRGMIGRNRNYLQDRVARAILAERKEAADALASKDEEVKRLREAWDWLSGRTNLELSFEHDFPEEGDGAWQVHRVSGNRSDLEWELVGTGKTALEAVKAAHQALQGDADVSRGKEEVALPELPCADAEEALAPKPLFGGEETPDFVPELLEMVQELRRALWEFGAPEDPEEWKLLNAVRDLTARVTASRQPHTHGEEK